MIFGGLGLSVCLSVCHIGYLTYLSFIQYLNAVERPYFTKVNAEVILRSKPQRSRSLGTKIQIVFCAYLREKWLDFIFRIKSLKVIMETRSTDVLLQQIAARSSDCSWKFAIFCHPSPVSGPHCVFTLAKFLRKTLVCWAGNYILLNSVGENRMIVGLFVLKIYYCVTDRRTDRQTDIRPQPTQAN